MPTLDPVVILSLDPVVTPPTTDHVGILTVDSSADTDCRAKRDDAIEVHEAM